MNAVEIEAAISDLALEPFDAAPDGHFKFPHLWPVKFPQAGRLNYQSFGLTDSCLLSW